MQPNITILLLLVVFVANFLRGAWHFKHSHKAGIEFTNRGTAIYKYTDMSTDSMCYAITHHNEINKYIITEYSFATSDSTVYSIERLAPHKLVRWLNGKKQAGVEEWRK